MASYAKFLDRVGLVASIPAAVLVGELIYEQTLLTWSEGPQMVGFSIAHLYRGYLLLGFGSYVLCVFWCAWFLYRLSRRDEKATGADWTGFALVGVVVLLVWIPYGAWQNLTVRVMGPGPRSHELLQYFSFGGSWGVVDVLLEQGVDADWAGDDGMTALMMAAKGGQLGVVDSLLRNGANPCPRDGNGVNAEGWALHEGHRDLAARIAVTSGDCEGSGGQAGADSADSVDTRDADP